MRHSIEYGLQNEYPVILCDTAYNSAYRMNISLTRWDLLKKVKQKRLVKIKSVVFSKQRIKQKKRINQKRLFKIISCKTEIKRSQGDGGSSFKTKRIFRITVMCASYWSAAVRVFKKKLFKINGQK